MLPSSSTHQSSAGCASVNSTSPASTSTLLGEPGQLAELVVGEAVEEGQRPQVGEDAHVVAR